MTFLRGLKNVGKNPSTVIATLSSLMVLALVLWQQATLPGALDMVLEAVVILSGTFIVGYVAALATKADY